MRKLLLLITVLLTGVSGALADEAFTVIDNAAGGTWPNGTYSSSNASSNWQNSWTSTSTTPEIKISAGNNDINNSTGVLASGSSKLDTYTITISKGYHITGYDITFENSNTDGSHNQTITPYRKTGVTASGASSNSVTERGLYNGSTTFDLSGENSGAKITSFKIYYTNTVGTWSSGVPDSELDNKYSTIWYVELRSPNCSDVFFDAFELTHRSNGSNDTDATTYLAFTENKFASQNNHNANEFIAISTTSITGHDTDSPNTVNYSFPDKVRLNANSIIYACFVSKNSDGTYNLQKRGVGVKSTTTNGVFAFSAGDSYTTDVTFANKYQCHYTCTYTTDYSFPRESENNYRIWSGKNEKDRTSGGKIGIAYMKYTAPGSAAQIVQFGQFSMSMRGDSNTPADAYLLFSKECLTGTGVTETTDFAPNRFTAISTNCIPSTGWGKVFTFTFDSDQFLHGGQTYYVYMGIKNGSNFRLRKYGLYIKDNTTSSGFQISSALETADATIKDTWQPIYYSSRCSFVDPSSLLESTFGFVANYSGTSLGKYTSNSYTQDQIATAKETAESAYAGSDGSAKFLSYLTLRDIKESLTTLNLPAGNNFLRIRGNSNKCITANTATSVAQMSNASNATTIFYLTSDKKLISYSNGLGLYWTHAFAAPSNASSLNTFTFSEGGSTGKYTIQSNATTVHGTTVDEYLSDGGESSLGRSASISSPATDWTLLEMSYLPVTISDAGYATLYSPVALTIPTGITAYVAAQDVDNRLRMTPISDGIIPANCGVVLKGAQGSYNFTTTTGGTATSLLKGDVATITKPENAYYLSNGDSGFGFYKAGSATTLAGFKAYYEEESGGTVKQFIFEDADGIKVMENGQWTMDNANIFNLAGQRMNKLQRGVNIVNGKKIIVK